MTRTQPRHCPSRGPLGVPALSLLLLLLLPSAVLAARAGESGGPEAARIATAQGGVFVRGATQGDWGYADPNLVLEEGDEVLAGSDGELTVEFPNSVFVTLSQGSRLEIESFHPGLHLRLRYGTFHVVLLEDLHGYERARIEWPRGSVFLEERGCYRADVFRDGLARVAALRGEAIVSASGGRSIVAAGESVYIEPGGLPSNEGGYLAGDYDAYDRYVLDRYFSPQWPALPPFLAGYGGAVGLRDLSRYGQWIYVPAWGKYAWRPRGVARTWRPYRDGRYVFTGFGWTWMPREPWGYAPCHYGNWGYLPKYGWLWAPGRRFAPAWVRWGQTGNTVGWAVIGPNGQIVVPPAAIYGSPYVFMAAKDFKAGKPVKQMEPKGKPQDMKLVDEGTPILEPDPEAKIKAPKLKPGHPSPADQAAQQAEETSFKQAEKSRKEAERAAHARGRGGHKASGAPAAEAPETGALVETPTPPVVGAPAPSGPASPEVASPEPEPSSGSASEPAEGEAVESPPATEEPSSETPKAEPGEESAPAPEETPPAPGSVTPSGETPSAVSPPPPTPGVTSPSSPGTPSSSAAPAAGTPAAAGAPGSHGKGAGGKHGGAKPKVTDAP